MQVIPLEQILAAIRYGTDRKMFPKNEPARSWSERRLLKAIAENYCSSVIVPSLVAAWEAAGKAPATKAMPPVGHMADIDRSHHDSEHAPAGPHLMSQPDAAPLASPAPVERAEPPPAVQGIPRTGTRTSGATRERHRPFR